MEYKFEFIQLKEHDNIVIEKIYKQSFDKVCLVKFNSLWDSEGNYWEYSYGLRTSEQVSSVSYIIDSYIKIRNKYNKCLYGSYIATCKDQRGKGLAKEFFYRILELAREKGCSMFVFDPFSHSFYRRLGGEVAFDANILKFNKELICEESKDFRGKIISGNLKSNKELKRLYQVFHENQLDSTQYNEIKLPYIFRNSWSYNQDIMVSLAIDDKNITCGAIKYSTDIGILKISELRYSNMCGLYTLKKKIIELSKDLNDIVIENVPKDFPILSFLKDYHYNGHEIKMLSMPFRMIRIVDIKEALSENIVSSPKFEITIKVVDEFYSFNDGVYKVSKDNSVVKCDDRFDIKLSINSCVELITGKLSIPTLILQDKIYFNRGLSDENRANIINELLRMFPETNTFSSEEL